MKLEIYSTKGEKNEAHKMLTDMVENELLNVAYADVIRWRVRGYLKDKCIDNYYVAYTDEKCLSRLWTGWGKHKDAVGNFGHFKTLEELRGQGIGKKILEMWKEDIFGRDDLPLALFCSAKPRIAAVYASYGFVKAIPSQNEEENFLYNPLKNAPATFDEFCKDYYKPSDTLIHKRADIEYRHEIDCLLKFALVSIGEEFNMGEYELIEEYIVRCPERVGMLFTEDGHCVGWSLDDKIKVHPIYKDAQITDER